MSSVAGPRIGADASQRVDALHSEYRGAVLSYCRRRLPCHEEAEDATQTVFLSAYRSLAAGVQPQSESAWLFAIASNVVLQRHRTIARRARVEMAADVEALDVPASVSSIEDTADLGLTAALREMPELTRRAFFLREWQGLSYQEVAHELGISPAAVEGLLRGGRRRLAGHLNEHHRWKMPRLGGLCLPWSAVRSLLGPSGAVHAVAGVASVAVLTTAVQHVGPPPAKWGGWIARRPATRAHVAPAPRTPLLPRAIMAVTRPEKGARPRVHPRPATIVYAHIVYAHTSTRPVLVTDDVSLSSDVPTPVMTDDSPPPASESSSSARQPSVATAPASGSAPPDAGPPTSSPPPPTTPDSNVMPATAAVCTRRSAPANSQGAGDPSGPTCQA